MAALFGFVYEGVRGGNRWRTVRGDDHHPRGACCADIRDALY
jgi:hypothetical protein